MYLDYNNMLHYNINTVLQYNTNTVLELVLALEHLTENALPHDNIPGGRDVGSPGLSVPAVKYSDRPVFAARHFGRPRRGLTQQTPVCACACEGGRAADVDACVRVSGCVYRCPDETMPSMPEISPPAPWSPRPDSTEAT